MNMYILIMYNLIGVWEGNVAMIRCVISDLDGTLLNKGRLSENNYKAIKLLEDNDISFIVATGRPENLARMFLDDLGFDCNRILMNGASYITADGEVLFMNCLSKDNLRECVRVFEEYNCAAVFNGLYDTYSLWTSEELEKVSEPLMRSYGFDDFEGFHEMYTVSKEELLEKQIMKIEISFNDMDLREICRRELEKIEGLTVTSALPFNIEVNVSSCNKGEAVNRICEIFGYKADEVACFGDSENDIPMLQEVYYSYAMDNADEKVKKAARFICEDVADDGFYKQVLRILNKG